MKTIRLKPISVFVACLLLLSGFAMPVMGWECNPQCGNCEDCVDGQCVEYGNCWGGCPDCYSCVDCYCEWDCSAGQTCCGGSCCSNVCCNGVCCEEGKICCPDGSCAWPCADGEPTGECDTSHNEECVECLLLGLCTDYTMREYYGSEVRYCTGGCPGDCYQQNAVECYVECECKMGRAIYGHSCSALQHCNVSKAEDICFTCTKNPRECEPIEYSYPTKCQ